MVTALRSLSPFVTTSPVRRSVIRDAADGFFSASGSEAELIEAIALTTRLVRGRRAA
jgi:hypothetical protein